MKVPVILQQLKPQYYHPTHYSASLEYNAPNLLNTSSDAFQKRSSFTRNYSLEPSQLMNNSGEFLNLSLFQTFKTRINGTKSEIVFLNSVLNKIELTLNKVNGNIEKLIVNQQKIQRNLRRTK
ncbi:Hypothetical_protein [Hexamita inflata]|uniref:Hypothetical_protein n=1 Tax=Hexamita inflata TaxID=28002 RepID=A0AA86Q4B9_9EUKA|nr:Hypothetical protein HINF_LOCUS37961 [Hexamita inflata]